MRALITAPALHAPDVPAISASAITITITTAPNATHVALRWHGNAEGHVHTGSEAWVVESTGGRRYRGVEAAVPSADERGSGTEARGGGGGERGGGDSGTTGSTSGGART